jgi:hemoglobin-like flavoprotein
MNISDLSIKHIETTSSLIHTNAQEIAKTMYILLFDLYPDYKSFFKKAPSNQHELLAETISFFAVNIKNIAMFEPLIQKIALVHVDVGVKEEHYKVIEDMMLLSFKIHLSEKVAGLIKIDHLLNSWSEAIKYVSHLLITKEKEIYSTMV